VPPIRAYDPAFAYELAAIVRVGFERMYGRGEDHLYYVTLYNENHLMPRKPDGVDEGIVRGLYRFLPAPDISGGAWGRVRLVASGAILQQALAARELLAERFGVGAEVYSATSWQLLRRDALEAERWNRLHPAEAPRVPYVSQVLGTDGGPVVLVSDWVKALPDLLGRWLPAGYVSLGTDGFGRSDTREALRGLFEIDAPNVAVAALALERREGAIPASLVAGAIAALGIDPEKLDPLAL
jgi:pyruvate dehydrogenase E1 component